MKKILEVLQYGDGELRFNTDLDVLKDPMAIMDLTVAAMFSMATKLWGGNEQSVVAVIRSLFVADMAISPDRKIVLKGLGKEAEQMGEDFLKMMKKLQEQGKAMTFPEAFAQNVTCYHAGDRRQGDALVTAGGRVLGVTAIAPTLREALSDAYAAAETIDFEGKYMRHDIGQRALAAMEGL